MKVLAQLTDLHTDDFLAKKYKIDTRKNVEAALDAVRDRGIGEVVLTGDLGSAASLPWLYERIRERRLEPHFLLGNHDKAASLRGLDGTGSLMRPDGLYYELRIEGTLCLFLDSSSASIGEDQFRWIRERTGGEKDRRLVVFTHHPVLDCGRSLMDQRFPLKNRDDLAAYLETLDREVSIFCGHYHTDHTQRRGRIDQYVTPSLFVQFKSHAVSFQVETTDIAFRVLEFDGEDLRTELVPIDRRG